MKRALTSSSGRPASAIHAPGTTTPLDWAHAAGQEEPVLRAIATHVRRRRRWRLAAGAGALVLLLAGGIVMRSPESAPALASALRRSSVVVQPERQLLPDGSVIELRHGAAVAVDFSSQLRRVVLQRGEAHFQVTKDSARPFCVEAFGVGVRAVGTAFTVHLGERAIDVLVTEGRVAVAAAVATAPPAWVDAGNRIVVDLASAVVSPTPPVPVSDEEMLSRLAWRVPRLEFSGAPLAEVVALFNRHSAGPERVGLVLADPELGKLRLSGVLRADNVSVLLSILDTSYGLKARRMNDGGIVLHRPN